MEKYNELQNIVYRTSRLLGCNPTYADFRGAYISMVRRIRELEERLEEQTGEMEISPIPDLEEQIVGDE